MWYTGILSPGEQKCHVTVVRHFLLRKLFTKNCSQLLHTYKVERRTLQNLNPIKILDLGILFLCARMIIVAFLVQQDGQLLINPNKR